ncbi:unnamed protein product [Urochloa humidicola]
MAGPVLPSTGAAMAVVPRLDHLSLPLRSPDSRPRSSNDGATGAMSCDCRPQQGSPTGKDPARTMTTRKRRRSRSESTKQGGTGSLPPPHQTIGESLLFRCPYEILVVAHHIRIGVPMAEPSIALGGAAAAGGGGGGVGVLLSALLRGGDRSLTGAASAFRGLQFLNQAAVTEGWSEVEKRFHRLAVDGYLLRPRFSQCIGMVGSEQFAEQIFDALAWRRGITAQVLTKDQVREFWEQLSDPGFDAKLRTFFDMVDKNADGQITEEELKEV